MRERAGDRTRSFDLQRIGSLQRAGKTLPLPAMMGASREIV
ncbi:Hypothetical protein A7982_05648 [Minicystis rosea]|nr:Hypothetical protein A7982_05648 [Minicystis rosea]